MARQIDREAQQERRRYVDHVISEIRAAIASRAIEGVGSLRDYRIDELARELEGMRRHLRRTLVGALGHHDGEAVEASLFTGGLGTWKAELRELKIDRLARRALDVHELVVQARAVLPEIEAARREHYARERVKWEAEAAARETAFQRRIVEENPRRLKYADVVALLRQAGYTDLFPGPLEVPFYFARRPEVNVITDLEFELARRDYGQEFSFYD